jgi:hypothetical protein
MPRRALSPHCIVALLVVASMACQVGGTAPPPVPTATALPLPTVRLPTAAPPTPTPLSVATRTPTATEAAQPGTISGWVWHDLCDPGPNGDPAPTAAPPGCVAGPGGDYRANGVREANEPVLSGIVVRLGAGACPSTGAAESATASSGPSYTFSGLSAGTYCVSVDPFAEPNLSRLLPGRWTAPGVADGLLGQTVALAPGQTLPDVSFGWDFQFLPSATSAPPGACTFAASLIEDVTVPPNTVFTPGTAFVKTWRVRNEGTCTWGRPEDALRSLTLVGGTSLGAPQTVPIPAGIPPGFTADLSIGLTAPAAPGTYLSEWKLLAAPDTLVGVGPGGGAPLGVQIVVTSTVAALRPGAVFHAPRRASPPALDAGLGEWPDGLPFGITQNAYRPENWSGLGDQSGAFAAAWDSSNLYLAIRVSDDVFVQTQVAETLFRGDSVELLVDADLSGDFSSVELSGDDYQLGLSPGANRATPEAYLWFPAGKTGRPAGVVVAAQPASDNAGFVLEVAVPWSLLGVTPAAGSAYGFALSASDNDAPGTAEQQSMISTEPGRRLANPTTWGTLILDP